MSLDGSSEHTPKHVAEYCGFQRECDVIFPPQVWFDVVAVRSDGSRGRHTFVCETTPPDSEMEEMFVVDLPHLSPFISLE